jgi:outer membrane protein OmpA-like peptidoglycan-associated protein
MSKMPHSSLPAHPRIFAPRSAPGALQIRRVPRMASLLLAAVSLALATQAAGAQPAAGPAAGFPAASARPPVPTPADKAVNTLVAELFRQIAGDGRKITVVIDPLMDGVTGAQTRATRRIDQRVADIVRETLPNVTILPFTPDNAATAQYVFIGTFNPINNAGQPTGERDAYWICFALVDREASTIAARVVGRAETAGVDATPAPVFAGSPVWTVDAATAAYIRACQRSKPGDPVDKVYIDRLALRAKVAQANETFERGEIVQAAAAYGAVAAEPGGADSAVALNGLYLAQIGSGRGEEAMRTFRQLVDLGLRERRMGVNLLFQTGSARFVADRTVSGIYPRWIATIAEAAAAAGTCLDIVGHASRTGRESVNLRLSAARAGFVRQQVAAAGPALSGRLTVSGVGSREVLVGLPVDGPQTALDRRVEFRPRACTPSAAR